MTRDDDDENEGDDDARRSSSARAYAKRRPPALALASGDKTPPGSPSGPFSLHSRRDSLSDASDSFSEVMKETVREEAPRTRSLVVRLKEGDDETLEVRVDAPRLDVVSRRRLGGEKFVFARARTDAERRRCRIARTYQMHVLRLSGTEEEVAGYASRAVAAADADVEDAVEYYVASENPFDKKVYGVARVCTRDVDLTLRTRYGVCRDDVDGVDALVDRFFATTAANELAGSPDGASFVRRFMLDGLRKRINETHPVRNVDETRPRTVCVLGAARLDVDGVRVFEHARFVPSDVRSYDDETVTTNEHVAREREDWVARAFFALHVVPLSTSWSERSRRCDEDSSEDSSEEPLVVTLHAYARRTIESGESREVRIARALARACGTTLVDDDLAPALVDALACALRDDSGARSHALEFSDVDDVDDAPFDDDDASATRALFDEPSARRRAVLCARASVESAEAVVDAATRTARDADADACVFATRCRVVDGRLRLCDGNVCMSDVLSHAASRGVFTEGGVFKTFVDSTTCVVFTRFVWREFRVRPSRPEDADALIAIEAEAWIDAPEMRTSPETIRERIENNASMNFVVEEIAGDVVRGCMYAQYVDDVEDLLNATWEWKESNRREPGSTKVVQLLDVFVDQSFAARCVSGGGSVGQELRNHVLNYAEHAGVRHACAVTRTRGFRQAQKHRPTLTYDEYVLGGSMDRGVFFHTSAGADVLQIVRPWRARDYENDGNGVLIRYDVREYAHSNAARRGRSALPSRLRRPSDPTRHREDGRYVSPLEAVAWEARARSFPVV